MRRPSARTERAAPGRGRRTLAAALLGATLGATLAAAAQDEPSLGDRLQALGPWPPAAPAAGEAQRAAVALGEQLFFSPRLGERGGVRCASCHEPWRRFADGRARALGLAEGSRNTPSLLNVGQHRRYGWDGLRDDLAAQALRPLADPREMPAGAAHVAALVRDDAALSARYAAAFGAAPADDEAALRGTGRALAAYVATLTSPRTPFDAWRDAVVAGSGAEPPSAAAARGFALFVGRGGCIACHAGPAFSDDAWHASLIRSAGADGRPDEGRGANGFRTPGLREVAATAPYMHDGSVATLCDAVRPHAAGQPAGLDLHARRDLVAFLETLQAGPAPASDAPRSCAAD